MTPRREALRGRSKPDGLDGEGIRHGEKEESNQDMEPNGKLRNPRLRQRRWKKLLYSKVQLQTFHLHLPHQRTTFLQPKQQQTRTRQNTNSFFFTPPSRSIRPNQRAATFPGQLISLTARRLVQLNLESLSNPFLQPLSKRKTYSSAYSLPPPKRTRQSKRVWSSKQDIEDSQQKTQPSNTQPLPTVDFVEPNKHKRQSLPRSAKQASRNLFADI